MKNDKFAAGKLMGVVALWLIGKKERSGYDILTIFKNEKMGNLASASRIYPLLADMEKAELVKRSEIAAKRKTYVYTITKRGKEVLAFASKHISSGVKGEFFREMLNAKN